MVGFLSGYRRNPIKSDEVRQDSVVFYWDSRRICQSESDRKESDNFPTGSDRNFLRLTGPDRAGFTWEVDVIDFHLLSALNTDHL